MNTKQKNLVTIAVLCALSVVLVMLVRFPIIPTATFLEYDPADIPLLIISFVFGPLSGLLATFIVAVIQGFTVSSKSGWVGIVMHIIATGTLVVVAGFVYKRFKSIVGAISGLLLGSICMTLIMIPSNLFFTVKFWGMPYDAVVAMLPTAIIPFNLIKAGINSIIVFFVYKSLHKLIIKISGNN